MMYRVKTGKVLHVPGCREIKSGQPVPEQIVAVITSLGNLSGLLSAGYLEQYEPEVVAEVVVEQPRRTVGRQPRFSQVTDGVAADKLIDDFKASAKFDDESSAE